MYVNFLNPAPQAAVNAIHMEGIDPSNVDDGVLCANQRRARSLGYRGAEVVCTLRGSWSLRYRSGLDFRGIIRRGLTPDTVLEAAHEWVAQDPRHRWVEIHPHTLRRLQAQA